MSWDSITDGMTATRDFEITEADMLAFATLADDHNPLHLDGSYARSLGYDGAVVFGALIVAKISGLIGMQLPGKGGVWTGLKMDFRAPFYTGEAATLTGTVAHRSDATRMILLKLRVDTADRCIATGSADCVYRADD
jgi:acyl dehydratase